MYGKKCTSTYSIIMIIIITKINKSKSIKKRTSFMIVFCGVFCFFFRFLLEI